VAAAVAYLPVSALGAPVLGRSFMPRVQVGVIRDPGPFQIRPSFGHRFLDTA